MCCPLLQSSSRRISGTAGPLNMKALYLFEMPEATHLTVSHPRRHTSSATLLRKLKVLLVRCTVFCVMEELDELLCLSIIILASSEFRLSLYRFLYHYDVNSDSVTLWKCTVNW